MTLTANRLRDVLTYDPATGAFVWKVSLSNRAKAGSSPRKLDSKGYPCVRIDGHLHRSHRLAFLYMTGRLPEGDIDHANGDRADNRWANLREATRQQNQRNKNSKLGASGVRGVKRLPTGKWRACITVDRKSIHLGCFSEIDAAKAAYALAAQKHFGEFARI